MNDERGTCTLQEILGQFTSWDATLAGLDEQLPEIQAMLDRWQVAEVACCGCGSTYYLSLACASLLQSLAGLRAQAFPASELWLFPSACQGKAGFDLLLAISRSGETTETLQAVRSHKKRSGSHVLAITCYPDSTLAREASLCLTTRQAEEVSIVQTRSFTSMLVTAHYVAALLAGRPDYLDELRALPALGRRVTEAAYRQIAEMGRNRAFDKLFFLGSGPNYGLACEGMLKMKESALSHSEAFSFLEFRHGPMSLVDPASLIVGLLSDTACEQERDVLRHMKELGGTTLVLAESEQEADSVADVSIGLGSGLGELARSILYLPLLQLLAFHRAMDRGLDPDRPRHLTAAVVL
jgi:glucosamine--fructose-6-phosphate aminotransferase (isomerizing)